MGDGMKTGLDVLGTVMAAAMLTFSSASGNCGALEQARAGGAEGFARLTSIDLKGAQAEAAGAGNNVPEAKAAPTGTLEDILPATGPLPDRGSEPGYRRIGTEGAMAEYKASVRQTAADSLAKLFPVSGKMDIGLSDSKYGPVLIGRAFWDEGGWGYGAMFDVYPNAPINIKYVFATPLNKDKNKIPKTPAALVERVNALSRLRIDDAQEEEFRGQTRPFKAFEGGRARVTVSYDPVFANYFPADVGAVMFQVLNGAGLRYLAPR